MNAEEYAARQAVVSAAVANYILQLGKLFQAPRLSLRDWLSFLEVLYPEVYQKRLEAAELARQFHDSERRRHGRAFQPRFLVEYDFKEFVLDMEPARELMQREMAPPSALGDVALRAVRSVENAGRKQIIRAVEDDSETGTVKGWARVATGRETCAWCLMLISRGPVYSSAENAGLDLDDESAAQLFRDSGGDLKKLAAYVDENELMKEWHTGCDCKVVPVYNRASWPGRDAYKRAEKWWIEATKEARRLIDSGEARSDNLNKEAQNALRRRLERGDLSMTRFALAA
ncbi:capsid maturation protease [Mycobacterium phage Achebe]|uniref:Capsid maturation protease n=1 Tax=Mycobacterium phage Backyardigan TaxID=2902881 RepID=G1BKY6_9CAUD|nr:head maturation protease [Mycobacterium phage Wile]YP_009635426.1 head maturation protease [Mycobacterium phage Backyardigan]AOT27522.1 capsid maturation protease [Mycobacterium phage Badger]APD17363.1 capsid maturation protease [Mycobacterium phage Achebe]QAY06922.1 capsid maturation protease [Mycobacterium phage Datway]QCW22663.1 capsid maturation protease [Mycobacterium phage Xena]AEJ94500.1 capsid maturation protease [Mycobacterium phage Backyardigan]